MKVVVYVCLAIITMGLGLLSRSRYVDVLPDFIGVYAGDMLWAALVFFGICIIRPTWSIRLIAFSSLLFAFSIELFQLYHAPWIDQIRFTTLGGLVLGFGFKISDLICYTLGVSVAAAIGFLINKHNRER